MKPSLKWPLLIAAAVIIARLPLELAGAPNWAANLLSVVALYLLIFPIAFAVQIARSESTRPYRDLLKVTAIYAALCRVMLMPIYWLSYVFGWTAHRFQIDGGGVVGGTALFAVFFPLGQILFWTVFAVVIGGGIGAAIIAFQRFRRS